MKKIFISVLFFIISIFPTLAADFLPCYTGGHYGTGALIIRGEVPVYEMSDLKSPLAAVIKIEEDKVSIEERGVKNPSIETTFTAYVKDENLAVLSVEIDDDEWVYVCYDKKRRLFGWIKKTENTDFMGWEDFMNLYGRKKGVYIMRNYPEEYKKLYSAPNTESTITDTFNFPKHISLWLIRGDWMLVKLTTYDGKTKTGWMIWKIENRLAAFPDFRSY